MGLLDKMSRTENLLSESTDLELPPDSSTIPAQVEPYVVRRSRVMLDYFTSSINDGSERGRKVSYLLKKLTNEALGELDEAPPEMLEYYLKQAAAVMWWGATGERLINVPLPPDFVTDEELDQPDVPSMTQAELRAELLAAGENLDGAALREAELAQLEAADNGE